VVNAFKSITGRDKIPQPVVDELQRMMFTPFKNLTRKDFALLKKYNISGSQIKDMQGLIPAIGGIEAVSIGAERAASDNQ
jgi:hypothetical protein